MTIIILIVAPEGLRGHLARWMVEVHAGVWEWRDGSKLGADLSTRQRRTAVSRFQPHRGDLPIFCSCRS